MTNHVKDAQKTLKMYPYCKIREFSYAANMYVYHDYAYMYIMSCRWH